MVVTLRTSVFKGGYGGISRSDTVKVSGRVSEL
jgi:hypothetical protein